MNIESVISTILSGVIGLLIYNHIGRNLGKLIKLIASIFIPVGSLIWIHEIFLSSTISFRQFGAYYLLASLLFMMMSKLIKIALQYTKVHSQRYDPVNLLYFGIFALSLFAFNYILENI